MSNKQKRQQADHSSSDGMALPSWKGRFTPADSLVKDLAAPEIVKAEEHREGEGPLEKNVFEFVINMNTRIVL